MDTQSARWSSVVFTPLRGDGLVVRLGMFALVVVGLHVGADRADDLVFFFVNTVDGLVDAVLGASIRWVGELFGAPPSTLARATYVVEQWIDLDLKVAAAKESALLLELVAAALVALPLLARPAAPQSCTPRGTMSDPTLLSIALPVSVLVASAAGAVVVANEVHVGLHGLVVAAVGPLEPASLLARAIGFVTLVSATWFLGVRAALLAVGRARDRTLADRRDLVSPRRRRTRGLVTTLVAAPLALAGIQGVGVISSVKALVLP